MNACKNGCNHFCTFFFFLFLLIIIDFMIRLPRGSFRKSVVTNYTKCYNSPKLTDDGSSCLVCRADRSMLLCSWGLKIIEFSEKTKRINFWRLLCWSELDFNFRMQIIEFSSQIIKFVCCKLSTIRKVIQNVW